MKYSLAILITCILLSLAISWWWHLRVARADTSRTATFVEAEATIVDVIAPRMSRYGVQPARYGIRFTGGDGQVRFQNNCVFARKYQTGDQLTIYYNPAKTTDPVTDKK